MSTTAPPVSSVPVALGRARLPRVDRTVLLALALAGALGLALGLAGLGGVDDAAHRYQASVFSVDGWTAWDNYWYAGRYGVVNYSLLFYPLAAIFGVVTVAVAATTASSGLFALIVMHQWGRPARWSALLFAVSAPALLAAGQYPFALGTAFSLLALLAAQRGRPWLLVAAALATALSSPLAFAFLVVTLGGLLLGGGRKSALRSATVAIPLCAILLMLAAEVAIYQAFPGGGPFPYPAADLAGITAFALCGLLLARGSQLTRPLGGLFLAYLAIAWWAKLFPSPLGGNATRVLDYAAAPLLALVVAVRGPQARTLGVLALAVSILWQAAPFVQNVAASFGEQAQSASYWQPVISFLHQPGRHDPANFRVEVVSTARHYESYYLTRGEGEAIPRGWYRQNDFPTNGVLYDRTLSAGAYQRWLRLMGVRYVFLPVNAALDPSAKAEAALLRSGHSGLREISISKNFRAFELPDATPMLTLDAPRPDTPALAGQPSVLRETREQFWLSLPQAGTYLLRVHYSPYWRVDDPAAACVEPGPHGMTQLRVVDPGPLRVRIDVNARTMLNVVGGARSGCAFPPAAPPS
jgi:hypothetical protein